MVIKLEDAIKAYQHCSWVNWKYPSTESTQALKSAEDEIKTLFGSKVWKIGYRQRGNLQNIIYVFFVVDTFNDAMAQLYKLDPTMTDCLYSECVFGWRK